MSRECPLPLAIGIRLSVYVSAVYVSADEAEGQEGVRGRECNWEGVINDLFYFYKISIFSDLLLIQFIY
jgi:hypothetical protein